MGFVALQLSSFSPMVSCHRWTRLVKSLRMGDASDRIESENPDEMRVCTNRTCRKQGSFQIFQTLSALAPPHLLVKPCGCLARCGSGPNVLLLPQGLILSHCTAPSRAAQLLLPFYSRQASSAAAVSHALTALALRNRALSEIDKRNFVEAHAFLTQAIDLKPFGGLHVILKDRSVAKLGMREFLGALEDIKQALTLAPNYPEAYMCQGDAYVATGQYDRAKKSYLTCVELDPSLRRSKSFKVRIENLQKKVVGADMT